MRKSCAGGYRFRQGWPGGPAVPLTEHIQDVGSPLRGGLARLSRSREDIAKAWLIQVIGSSSLSSAADLPMGWAASDLPELVGEILAAAGEPRGYELPDEAVTRVKQLVALRDDVEPAQVGREVAALHGVVLTAMRRELLSVDPELFAEATERLAALFGPLTGATVETLMSGARAGRDPLTGLARADAMPPRLEQLIAAQKRYDQPFAVVLFDVDSLDNNGSGGSAHDEALATVATALRQAIRLVDEGYRLDDDELCLLAPMLRSEQGAAMAERLHARLASPGALRGRPITIAAGVVSCPEHGDDPQRLLRQADTAMWRARATGRAVTVGGLQDPSHSS